MLVQFEYPYTYFKNIIADTTLRPIHENKTKIWLFMIATY